MKRQIITIDREKCNGCGLCARACHEGAIGIVDGKAMLLREDYCDGLGDCLPACPTNAITFEMREAPAYDEKAVLAAKLAKQIKSAPMQLTGCSSFPQPDFSHAEEAGCMLRNFPVQIKLAPVNAPYFEGAHLLIAADCTAYCYANFHRDFIAGKVTLIGCPKLDGVNYAEKLGEILRRNTVERITLVRMEVPCCGGLAMAVRNAIALSGRKIPSEVVTVTTNGRVLS